MDNPIVTVKQGKLKGVICQSVLGSTYHAFRGIPYAAPPIGELRFKDAQPPIPWSGIRDASVNGGICAQHIPHSGIGFRGSDDCLYLNVYTPSLTGQRPVMVWIHGGSFLTGAGNDSNKRPDYLITRDVVIVSVNYRLGAFGFLNLRDKVAPGNQGLKDIITALQWVKENISNFGGNTDNITIFGDSVGGVLVHCLVISPAIKGRRLFHKAISQSGLLTNTWARNAGPSEYSFRLASSLGAKSNNPEEIVKFLQTLSCEEIIEAQHNLMTVTERSFFQLPFGCVVDDVAEVPVLPLPFDELFKNDSDIPYIIGSTSHEFLMFFPTTTEAFFSKMDKSLSDHIERHLPSVNPNDVQRLTMAIRERYFDGKPISTDNIHGFVKLFTDLTFTNGVTKLIENRRERTCAPMYAYRFSYIGEEKCTTDLLVKRAIPGASHVDDACYLFYPAQCKIDNPDPPAEGTKDRLTIERMIGLWTNFAKTGNPTPGHDEFVDVTWEPISKKNSSYLNIGDELEMKPYLDCCLEALLK